MLNVEEIKEMIEKINRLESKLDNSVKVSKTELKEFNDIINEIKNDKVIENDVIENKEEKLVEVERSYVNITVEILKKYNDIIELIIELLDIAPDKYSIKITKDLNKLNRQKLLYKKIISDDMLREYKEMIYNID